MRSLRALAIACVLATMPCLAGIGVILDAAGQVQVRYFNPRWSPDGRRIMLGANLESPRRFDLFVISQDATVPVKLREDARDGSWSPDGSRIAFASMTGGDLEVFVMNADGSALRQLTNDSTMDYLPAWSPDGRRIAFVSIPPGQGQHHDVHIMNADGTGRAELTRTPSEEMGPTWAPDGRHLAFGSNRDGNWEIYLMSTEAGEARRLTSDPTADNGPVFSPDGSSIAFSSDRGGSRRMWRMRPDGTEPAPLGTGTGSMMSWSPDGRRMAYVAVEEGSQGVFLMNADGTGSRRMTPVPTPQTATDRLERLRWLAGCWERRSGQQVTLEMWMLPAGGLMLGASRTVAGGVTREFEQLILRAEGDGVAYTALPSGQREATFKSTQISDSSFTVENPAHDFPQRIVYRRRGADSLLARIEGPGSSGVRTIDFPMRRVGCAAP